MWDVLILALVEIVGDFGLKKYANTGVLSSLFTGIGGYVMVVIMLIVSLKNSSVLYVNNAWDGLSSLLESIAAFVFLGERFSSSSQYFGVIMIIGGIYFLKTPLF